MVGSAERRPYRRSLRFVIPNRDNANRDNDEGPHNRGLTIKLP